jgi:hypothetical protein
MTSIQGIWCYLSALDEPDLRDSEFGTSALLKNYNIHIFSLQSEIPSHVSSLRREFQILCSNTLRERISI